MTRRELGTLVFKIGALYLWLSAFQALVSTATMNTISAYFDSRPLRGTTLLHSLLIRLNLVNIFVPAICYSLAGWYLAVRSERLAKRLFGGQEDEAPLLSISLLDAQTLAFAVVGLYLCTLAVPRFLGVIISYLSMGTGRPEQRFSFNDPASVWRKLVLPALESTLQIILGAIVFFSGRNLAMFWHRTRPAAQPPATPADVTEP